MIVTGNSRKAATLAKFGEKKTVKNFLSNFSISPPNLAPLREERLNPKIFVSFVPSW